MLSIFGRMRQRSLAKAREPQYTQEAQVESIDSSAQRVLTINLISRSAIELQRSSTISIIVRRRLRLLTICQVDEVGTHELHDLQV